MIEESTAGAWSIVPSPSSPTGLGSTLNDVTCPSANLCIAVGKNENATSTPTTLIEQNTGDGWTIVPSPNPTSFGAPYGVLNGVTCASAVDCIAVGVYDSESGLGQPLIEENRGSGWVIVPSPVTRTDDVLVDVTCMTAARCFAVGSTGGQTGDLVMQRSGDGGWAIVYRATAPPCASGTPCIRIGGLDDVACSRAGTCIASGIGHLESTGGDWSTPGAVSTGENLPSRVTCGAHDCIGAGTSAEGEVQIDEDTDGTWSPLTTLTHANAWRYSFLSNDIACASGDHCVVVGWWAFDQGPRKTLIVEGSDRQWKFVSSPNMTHNLASGARAASS
jgi:hypothetical protein